MVNNNSQIVVEASKTYLSHDMDTRYRLAIEACHQVVVNLISELRTFSLDRSNLGWFRALFYNVELTNDRVTKIADPLLLNLTAYANITFDKTTYEAVMEIIRTDIERNSGLTILHQAGGAGDLDETLRGALFQLGRHRVTFERHSETHSISGRTFTVISDFGIGLASIFSNRTS